MTERVMPKNIPETVQGAARSLQCVYNVECSDRLALRMLSVSDRITDNLRNRMSTRARDEQAKTNVFKEDLENTASLFVDET